MNFDGSLFYFLLRCSPKIGRDKFLLTLAAAFLPGFRELFGIHGTLSGKEFLISAGLALSTLPVFEAGKAIQRAARRKKA